MQELCFQREGCRHHELLRCFGDALPSQRCGGMCDLCASAPHPLLPPRPGVKMAEKQGAPHDKRFAGYATQAAGKGKGRGKGKGGKGGGGAKRRRKKKA